MEIVQHVKLIIIKVQIIIVVLMNMFMIQLKKLVLKYQNYKKIVLVITQLKGNAIHVKIILIYQRVDVVVPEISILSFKQI